MEQTSPVNPTRRAFLLSTGGAIAGAVTLPVLIGASSCGNSLTLTLDLISVAADSVLPFIPGIPALAVPIIQAYLDAAVVGVQESATELASTDTAAQKTIKIAAIWAGIVEPDLTKLGVTGTAAAKIIALVNAILSFLQKIGAPTVPTTAAAAAGLKSHAATMAKPDVTDPIISAKDAAKVIAKAKAVQAKIR